ncbi:12752_t:CDS:1, partial [Entrophospora sp. SA101]
PLSSSSFSSISPITTSDTSDSDKSNSSDNGGGVPTPAIIAVAVIVTFIVSAVIVFFVRRKLKILKSSRGSSANFFDDLDGRRRLSVRNSIYKRRTSLLAPTSRILNNNHRNSSFSPTRLITENYSADGHSNDNNNEAVTSSRLTRNSSSHN